MVMVWAGGDEVEVEGVEEVRGQRVTKKRRAQKKRDKREW
jgi:hypothetical protein